MSRTVDVKYNCDNCGFTEDAQSNSNGDVFLPEGWMKMHLKIYGPGGSHGEAMEACSKDCARALVARQFADFKATEAYNV